MIAGAKVVGRLRRMNGIPLHRILAFEHAEIRAQRGCVIRFKQAVAAPLPIGIGRPTDEYAALPCSLSKRRRMPRDCGHPGGEDEEDTAIHLLSESMTGSVAYG